MKIFGKTLREYLLPVKFYIIAAIVIVISQYYVAPLVSDKFPIFLQLTQAFWITVVALAVSKLVLQYNFNIKSVFFTGILFSLIIHGLKAFFFRVFLFPYSGTITEVVAKIIYKFLYGSALVMITALASGAFFIFLKKKRILH